LPGVLEILSPITTHDTNIRLQLVGMEKACCVGSGRHTRGGPLGALGPRGPPAQGRYPDSRLRRQARWSGPQARGNPPGGRIGRTWRTMPDRLTVMVAPQYFGIGTGERFHLGEPLPLDPRGAGDARHSPACPCPGSLGRLSGGLSRTPRDRVGYVLCYPNALLTVGARPVVRVRRSPALALRIRV
jgi:hypothetical protein